MNVSVSVNLLVLLLVFPSLSDFSGTSVQLTEVADPPSINQLNQQFIKTNQYFQALSELRAYETDDRGEQWLKMQYAFNYASFLGDNEYYREYVAEWEKRARFLDTEIALIQNSPDQGIDAVREYVLKYTSGEQVVMFNESHFYPSHRLLLKELLPMLKEAGFTHLAMEALYDGSTKALNKGKPVQLNTGYYTREQHFQQLIREAQRLGLELVAYDGGGANREQVQAKNLYERTIGQDADARVIVYAGYAHIDELPSPKGKERMATIFKRDYKIDPVTFSQTAMFQYRDKVEAVCVLEGAILEREYMPVDHVIVNNLSTNEPSGNFTFTNKREETVQVAVFDNATYNANKPYSNLPIKSALLSPGETYRLSLDTKRMRLVTFNAKGEVLEN